MFIFILEGFEVSRLFFILFLYFFVHSISLENAEQCCCSTLSSTGAYFEYQGSLYERPNLSGSVKEIPQSVVFSSKIPGMVHYLPPRPPLDTAQHN